MRGKAYCDRKDMKCANGYVVSYDDSKCESKFDLNLPISLFSTKQIAAGTCQVSIRCQEQPDWSV